MKRFFLSFLLVFSFFLVICYDYSYSSSKEVILYFFWGDGCPHCAKEKEFLSILKKKYPQLNIRDYEVWSNPASMQLLKIMSKAYNINPTGVPVTFIGNRALVGFSENVAKEIELTLKQCLKSLCEDPLFYKTDH